MAVDVLRVRYYCHVCVLLSFSYAIGLHVSRDVNKEFPANSESQKLLRASTAPPTSSYDVTRNAAVRSVAANDDVRKNAVNATLRPRRRRKAEIQYNPAAAATATVAGDDRSKPETVWSRELAARTLQELEQELEAARANCSGSSAAVASLNVELAAPVLDRFSTDAASAVHAANVVSAMLRSPPEAEVTSRDGGGGGDSFYFSFARAMVESAGGDWVDSATLVVERPGRTAIGPRAQRSSRRVKVTDAGRPDWYGGLLRRGVDRDRWTGRCGGSAGGDGDEWKATVGATTSDVMWSVPYVLCPSRAMVSLIVPVCRCDQHHDVIIRSENNRTTAATHSLRSFVSPSNGGTYTTKLK